VRRGFESPRGQEGVPCGGANRCRCEAQQGRKRNRQARRARGRGDEGARRRDALKAARAKDAIDNCGEQIRILGDESASYKSRFQRSGRNLRALRQSATRPRRRSTRRAPSSRKGDGAQGEHDHLAKSDTEGRHRPARKPRAQEGHREL